jgi:hypothetical protein
MGAQQPQPSTCELRPVIYVSQVSDDLYYSMRFCLGKVFAVHAIGYQCGVRKDSKNTWAVP